jgi:hypothetical protein
VLTAACALRVPITGKTRLRIQLQNVEQRPSCRWEEPDGRPQLYDIVRYESAGVWRDSDDTPCLVILADFEDDSTTMHLLYEDNRRDFANDVDGMTQWVVKSCGKGQHLTKADGRVKCDNPAKGP